MIADPRLVFDALRRADVPHASSFVYFVRAGSSGAIKIGRASDVGARLASLQTASAEPLELLAVVVGGCEVERALHRQFSSARIRGEWFRPAAELMEHIRWLTRAAE